MSLRFILLYFVLILPALGQGYGGLAEDAEGYAIPKVGISLGFPRDHQPHSDYKIEWWYVTANLRGEDGQEYGIQWTLFRSALGPFEKSNSTHRQIWMGHAALTTATEHFHAERTARGGTGQAGVMGEPFFAWIDNWEIKSQSEPSKDVLSHIQICASDVDFFFDLTLTADHPLIPQGQNGYSLKSLNGNASYYYSQPFYTVEGSLHFLDHNIKVRGQGWLDREWSSQPLSKTQKGWDWVSIHFVTGEKLMGYHMRDEREGFISGNWINPDGTTEYLDKSSIHMVPLQKEKVADREIPIQWKILLPSKNMVLEIRALNSQTWMKTKIPYWEGPIKVTGSKAGVGYLEMTGYE